MVKLKDDSGGWVREDKGKEVLADGLTGIIKGVSITPLPVFVLRAALWAVACAPLSPHPWSLRSAVGVLGSFAPEAEPAPFCLPWFPLPKGARVLVG